MDKLEVYRTLETFFPRSENRLIEVRAINPFAKNDSWSGFFYDYDTLWDAIQRFDTTHNLYFVLNNIDDRCSSMIQMNQILRGVTTIQDKDITSRRWVLLDIDTEKNHLSISSTDSEWQFAYKKTGDVWRYLLSQGFSQPIVCSSGNGLHMLFRIDDWANNDENLELVDNFLKSLSAIFSDENVEIDIKVGNAARITKLYGTVSKKGKNTKERPHRLSKILYIPDELKSTAREYFQKVASLLPHEKNVQTNTFSIRNGGDFNIDDFIKEHNIGVAKDITVNGIRKIVLEECPFNPSHTAPDSAVFVMPSGALGFSCFHASCSQYSFKDFRLHYDPSAYDKKDYFEYQNKRRYNEPVGQVTQPIVATPDKGLIWLKMGDINKPSFSYLDFIPSGIPELDRRGIGFRRGHVSVWTGKRGCGKSSILNMLILNAAQRTLKSALWTGELTGADVKEWLLLQAAGKQHTEKVYGTDYYSVPPMIADRISKWIDKYVRLFNNKYGENFSQIADQVRKLKEDFGLDQLLLDNLMVLDIRSLDENKYDRQSILLQKLEDLAKELNIHIHLVAHPHKSMGYVQVDNISGSGDIANKADNVFVMSRVNNEFKNNAKEYLPKLDYQLILDSGCTNIVEVCKFRTKGTLMGCIYKFWFEEESNRLKSDKAENIVYGWEDPPIQKQMDFNQEEVKSIELTGLPFAPSSNDDAPF